MYYTEKVFGRRELVHIVSPDFLSLPKLEMKLPTGVEIKGGSFVTADGQLATLTDTERMILLVVEDSHYNDYLHRVKPSEMIEGFFGQMLIHTKVFEEAGTAFVAGDGVSIADGKIVHVGVVNTINVGEVVGRGTDWLAIAMK